MCLTFVEESSQEKVVKSIKLPDAVATTETRTWRGAALSLMHQQAGMSEASTVML
jgi:hypothetical protein